MVISRRSLTATFGACVLSFCAWAVVSAQQVQPSSPAPPAGAATIQGESDRGVSMAIKNVVDKIAAPSGEAVKYFRVVSITGQRTAKSQKVVVDLEVRDTPYRSGAEKGG